MVIKPVTLKYKPLSFRVKLSIVFVDQSGISEMIVGHLNLPTMLVIPEENGRPVNIVYGDCGNCKLCSGIIRSDRMLFYFKLQLRHTVSWFVGS